MYRVPVLPRSADRAFRGGIQDAVGRVAPTGACEQRRAQGAPRQVGAKISCPSKITAFCIIKK